MVPGVAVTFSAPIAGASVTFGGAATVFTDGAGIATAPALTANGITGPFEVTASIGVSATAFGLVNLLAAPHVDIDANSHYDALTDGLLLIRYLFGLSGNTLTSGALGADAQRTDPLAVAQYMANIRPLLDIDANGQSDAFTDGLLLLRYLFGLRGDSLIPGAIGAGAMRNTPALIEPYIQSLLP